MHSMQWGAWAEVGMAASSVMQSRLEKVGMGALQPVTGLNALSAVLAGLSSTGKLSMISSSSLNLSCFSPFNYSPMPLSSTFLPRTRPLATDVQNSKAIYGSSELASFFIAVKYAMSLLDNLRGASVDTCNVPGAIVFFFLEGIAESLVDFCAGSSPAASNVAAVLLWDRLLVGGRQNSPMFAEFVAIEAAPAKKSAVSTGPQTSAAPLESKTAAAAMQPGEIRHTIKIRDAVTVTCEHEASMRTAALQITAHLNCCCTLNGFQ